MSKAKDRKNALDNLFGGGGMAGMVAAGASARPRLSSGAIGAAEINLIRDERDKLRVEVDELTGKLSTSVAVVELDTAKVQPSFVPDRMVVEHDPAFEALKASIKETGQQVPILVRPHPSEADSFQIAYGHRRWRACRELGMPVRGVVRELTDEELLIAQGQENHERKDLSFIETCLFVLRLSSDYPQSVICKAINKDKSLVSKYRKLAATMPEDFLVRIGPAPKIGRPRWEELAGYFHEDGSLSPGHQKAVEWLFASEAFGELDSDERFISILEALNETPSEAQTPPEQNNAQTSPVTDVSSSSRKGWFGEKRVAFKQGPKATSFTVDHRAHPLLASYLMERMEELVRQFEEEHGEEGQ
ncbi:plasmid partitioning protein RepB [Pseudovibrio sp. SPO723]|uniref:plasmid partitioning protein RepB n=1 Tax=Nesiotobacter zosterae TaxID=392721 RepID=UPI0029C5B44E|nr:plasmid partitioning protein RepB [Pseudovibrio sp. SPO723]MDX5594370.1 plasmid partitioning protein RepB [Pseudovibrio sp. SPO723]